MVAAVPHGALLVVNDDVIAPGAGFGTHSHRDMEIVTWVLEGAIEHRDSAGNHGIIEPGLAQRMSAGSGIAHSEMNASTTTPAHLVQMWVLPDTEGIEPGYEQLSVAHALATGELVPVASGRGHKGAITIRQKDAVLWVGRLAAGKTITVPDAPHVHVYVARGSVTLSVANGDADDMGEGDAARLTDAGSPTLTAGTVGTEVIVWQTA